MTSDVIIPFPEDLVYSDLVENNLPSADAPLDSPTPSSPNGSDEIDVQTSSDSVWTTNTIAGKEFRSSFLFQSSCYLPDADDGTESETSHSQRTPTKATTGYDPHGSQLHRDETLYTLRQPSLSIHDGIGATTIASILKLSATNTDNPQPSRRVMFDDSDDDNLRTNINNTVYPGNAGVDDSGADNEEKSSWMGWNRVNDPLHHTFHSIPQLSTTAAEATATTLDDSYHSQNQHQQLPHLRKQQHNQLPQYYDDDYPITIGSELQYSKNRDAEKRKRRLRIWLLFVLFLVVGSVAAVVTCGSTDQCGRKSQQEHLSASQPSTSPRIDGGSPPTVTKFNESFPPTMTPSKQETQSEETSPTMMTQTILTIPPSIAPTPFHEKIVIYSTEQLYQAVDSYVLYRYNKTIVRTDGNDYYNTPIGQWDVSRISNFTSVFSALRNPMMQYQFQNEDLSGWNTTNAVTMTQLFYGTEKWTSGNISKWITSNVIDMRETFARSSKFNEDLSLWDVSKVVNMEGMCTLKLLLFLLII